MPACVSKVTLRQGADGHDPRMSLAEAAIQASLLQPADGSRDVDGALNRSERIGFWLYVAMGLFCTAILLAAAASAIIA